MMDDPEMLRREMTAAELNELLKVPATFATRAVVLTGENVVRLVFGDTNAATNATLPIVSVVMEKSQATQLSVMIAAALSTGDATDTGMTEI